MSAGGARKLIELVGAAGGVPVLFGNALPGVATTHDLREHWLEAPFSGQDVSLRAQLFLFHELVTSRRIAGAIGAKSGAMDGPALLGVPTLYLEYENIPNSKRMKKWLGVVPGFERLGCDRFLNEEGATLEPAEIAQIETWLAKLV